MTRPPVRRARGSRAHGRLSPFPGAGAASSSEPMPTGPRLAAIFSASCHIRPRSADRRQSVKDHDRRALAIERHASFVPIARHAAWRTRTCGAARPATAQLHDPGRPATARPHTRPRPPSRPDPRCTHQYIPAEHQGPRNPRSARRSRSQQVEAAPHREAGPRARSLAAPNARTAEAPRTRPATRLGRVRCAPFPRRAARTPRRERGRPPRPPSARRNHCPGRARACAPGRSPRSSRTAASPRSRCSPESRSDAAAPRSQYTSGASGRQLANARPDHIAGFRPPGRSQARSFTNPCTSRSKQAPSETGRGL